MNRIFEYKTSWTPKETWISNRRNEEADIQRLGAEGWELVAVVERRQENGQEVVEFFWKREIIQIAGVQPICPFTAPLPGTGIPIDPSTPTPFPGIWCGTYVLPPTTT